MDSDTSPPSELQLGALYGRYRHWRSPSTPSSDAVMEGASIEPSLISLCALVVQFEASAREDLRVGFASSPDASTDGSEDVTSTKRRSETHNEWKYEVAVGTSGNTELVWRKSASGRSKEVDLIRVFTGRTCSAQEFIAYWVIVDVKKGLLSIGVGAQVGQDVLATYQDPDFVRVTQTAFTSWDSPVSLRGIQVHGVYEGQTKALAAANVATFPPPRLIVRADPLGKEDLLTAEQRQKYETEYAAAKRRAERFGALFAPPDIKKFLDPREVRKLQRTGAIVPGFSTGIDITSQEEQSKREQRMKRFDTPQFAVEYSAETARALEQGLTQEEWVEKQRDQEKLRVRAQKFGLPAEEDCSQVVPTGLIPASAKVGRERCDVKASEEGQAVAFREDALHMYSLDDKFQQVRTSDVMEYFIGYGPAYVEWLNDSSCTVVFQDNYTASRALIALGQEIPPQILKQKKEKVKAENVPAFGEDVDMADAETPADHDSTEDDEVVKVPDVAFNRSQWYLGNRPIGSQTQPRDKKWRVLLRKATDEDFPPEKIPKKGMYHSRGNQRHDARGSRRRNDCDFGPSPRRGSGRSRAHPYGEFREDRRGETPGSRRHRNKHDGHDTGKSSKRIRVNADGSINIVRDKEPAAPAVTSEEAVKPEAAPTAY